MRGITKSIISQSAIIIMIMIMIMIMIEIAMSFVYPRQDL